MQAIVSHDVDHLTLSEHYLKDLIVPKYFIRSKIEFLTGQIPLKELWARYTDIYYNKWEHIESLHTFNTKHKVPSYYFIGVKQGLGLSYSETKSAFWINKMLAMGCHVGVHGIAFEDFETIKLEFDLFKSMSQQNKIGTRMHYIRTNNQTFENMAKAGYRFDSSEMSFNKPYKINSMWEFPFQIMDGYIIEKPKQWQSKNLKQACEATKTIIDKVVALNLPYLGIDFHDRYFSKSHQTWMDWYTWLIEYLVENKITFVSFDQAIDDLENKA